MFRYYEKGLMAEGEGLKAVEALRSANLKNKSMFLVRRSWFLVLGIIKTG